MLNIAIDGPGGSGKSSVAKALAARMDLKYLDTGALYRALGLALKQRGVDPEDEQAVAGALPSVELSLEYAEDGRQLVFVNGEDLTPYLRTQDAADGASKVAVHGCVRNKLLGIQRETGKRFNVVMDGRDIGTVVLPGADLKIFLTASVEVRAKRRIGELEKAGHPHGSMEEIMEEIAQRDYRDSHREIAPLKQAEDAVLVDTSSMSLEEVIETVCSMVSSIRK
ncbi:MAG: (d)CMP kinase [Lachnospiraceae bacterium]|nr:(d)CMP kinase [Lachnospiraceae bacterium]